MSPDVLLDRDEVREQPENTALLPTGRRNRVAFAGIPIDP